MGVSFLFNRVRDPGVGDYKKLERLIDYTQGTIGMTMILSMDRSGNIKWYFDAAFTVHEDMRSNTGGFMNMVNSRDYIKSRKKNLNTKS